MQRTCLRICSRVTCESFVVADIARAAGLSTFYLDVSKHISLREAVP